MKVFVGADHRGFELKNAVREHLQHGGFDIEDVGALTLDDDDDYPKYAYAVVTKVLGEEDAAGVLVCGSGQGMTIAANRVSGIRAGLAWDTRSAELAKSDDDCNVLVLPADFLETDAALAVVDAWAKAKFKSDRKYHRRLDEIEELYG